MAGMVAALLTWAVGMGATGWPSAGEEGGWGGLIGNGVMELFVWGLVLDYPSNTPSLLCISEKCVWPRTVGESRRPEPPHHPPVHLTPTPFYTPF